MALFGDLEGETKLLRCLLDCRPTGTDKASETAKLHAALRDELGEDEYERAGGEGAVEEAVRAKYAEWYDEDALEEVWQSILRDVSPFLFQARSIKWNGRLTRRETTARDEQRASDCA